MRPRIFSLQADRILENIENMDVFLRSVIGNVGHKQGPVENKRDDREKMEHFVVGAMGGGLGNMLTSQT